VSAISTIAFVGGGNMGLPMVRNLLKAGFTVRTYDLSTDAMAATERDGAKPASTMRDAVADVDCVFTMLPMGHDVEAVFRGDEGLLAVTRPGALLVDSSTIRAPFRGLYRSRRKFEGERSAFPAAPSAQ
jgi:3-hydroxyisobutyrate dehydrogenase-like beta-hydroxyacid dehydrogenase